MKIGSHTTRNSGKSKRKSAVQGARLQGEPSPEARIWQVVAMIPEGRVASYGQVAALAGMPRHARLVGRTLSRLPAPTKLPWHRVVNASLEISLRRGSDGHREQRRRLEAEGVAFVGRRISRACRWEARAP